MKVKTICTIYIYILLYITDMFFMYGVIYVTDVWKE